MNWHMKRFSELTNEELYGLLKARVDVFVVEQECPYEDIDNLDQQAMHYFAEHDGEIAATVRILPRKTTYEEVAIGRVLVVKKFRGQGLARKIMQQAITFIHEEWKEKEIKLQAQTYLQSFYESLGFKQVSEVYEEDEIPHIDMLLTIK
ncbi:MAG TPA: GNAT family N-acetyltransferase [Bacillota bacterium]|nr:GNAT family N-acetyltransferase [Bacillota bacterium]